MRRLTFALALAVVALAIIPGRAESQETYSVAATAAQVTKLTKAISTSNSKTCVGLGLAITCTQAQACTAANAAGGAACTAAQARAANARIYGATQPLREEFVSFFILLPAFQELVNRDVAWDQIAFCAAFNAGTQVARDNSCAAVGQPAGCDPCPGP
jgi:hypothetical protein